MVIQNSFFDDDVRKKSKPVKNWRVLNHICKKCFGRLLMQRVSPTVNRVMCSECGESAYGNELALCWCGKSLPQHGKIFACVLNDNPRPELPNQVLVVEKKIEHKKIDEKQNRQVYCPDFFE